MNPQEIKDIHWSENVIIVDAEYVDRVAFNLICNFERMLNRRIPKVDFSRWAIDIALDGGMKQGQHETQVILLHDKTSKQLDNFAPSAYETELNAQAFRDDNFGEFIINSISIDDEMTCKEDVTMELLHMLMEHKELKRMMIVPDSESSDIWHKLCSALRSVDDEDKHITLFAMQPMEGGNFRQEIVGYSLMNAMGIKPEEFKD